MESKMEKETAPVKPHWFWNIKVFLACCCVAVAGKGVTFAYLNSVVTTLERRFSLGSDEMGMLVGASEIGYLSTVLIGSYVASHFHLPRCVGVSVFLLSISFFIAIVPFFLSLAAGPTVVASARNASAPTQLAGSLKNSVEFCAYDTLANQTVKSCGEAKQTGVGSNLVAYRVFLASRILAGASGSLVTPLTFTYIDNNCNRRYSSLYYGIFISMYPLGAIGGYLVGGKIVQIFEYPWLKVPYDERDPRWIGAWWMGFAIGVVIELLASIPLFFFPRSLPKPKSENEDESKEEKLEMMAEEDEDVVDDAHKVDESTMTLTQMIGNFLRILWGLLRNPAFILLTLMQMVHGWVFGGFGSFAPKYMEYHFQIRTSTTIYFIGLSAITGVIGMVVGGWFVSKYKWQPRTIAKACVVVSVINLGVFVAKSLLSCPQPVVYGLPSKVGGEPYGLDEKIINQSIAFDRCVCGEDRYFPICNRRTGVSYINPCTAHCQLAGASASASASTSSFASNWLTNVTAHHLQHCGLPLRTSEQVQMTPHLCPIDCTFQFYAYNALSALMAFIGTLTVGPQATLLMRYVKQDQSSRATSLSAKYTISSLFSWLPAPIVTGLLINAACLFNAVDCDGKSACRLYDRQALRWNIHALAIVCKVVALGLELALIPVIIWKDNIRKAKLQKNKSAL